MRIDHASSEDRRYTRHHDRILQALVEQITELNTRVEFLEHSIDSSLPAPTEDERRSALHTRVTSSALAQEIASIGLSLETVIASIGTPADGFDEVEQRETSTEPAVVDLSSLPRRPAWRSSSTRPAGWQPVATRRAV